MGVKSNARATSFCAAAGMASAAVRIIAAIGRRYSISLWFSYALFKVSDQFFDRLLSFRWYRRKRMVKAATLLVYLGAHGENGHPSTNPLVKSRIC